MALGVFTDGKLGLFLICCLSFLTCWMQLVIFEFLSGNHHSLAESSQHWRLWCA
jgi:hypothetical protein